LEEKAIYLLEAHIIKSKVTSQTEMISSIPIEVDVGTEEGGDMD
jgi:hypothetical protein